jgi:hypothetical protein
MHSSDLASGVLPSEVIVHFRDGAVSRVARFD